MKHTDKHQQIMTALFTALDNLDDSIDELIQDTKRESEMLEIYKRNNQLHAYPFNPWRLAITSL